MRSLIGLLKELVVAAMLLAPMAGGIQYVLKYEREHQKALQHMEELRELHARSAPCSAKGRQGMCIEEESCPKGIEALSVPASEGARGCEADPVGVQCCICNAANGRCKVRGK